jgi:metallo-beta-lactamase class B
VFTLPLLLATLAVPAASAAPPPAVDPRAPIRCDDCDEWNRPRSPFQVFGNAYYVGVSGLGAVLITSPAGHVLIDGGLPQSAARVEESLRLLGFQLADVKLHLSTHEHFDHAGAFAALQAVTHAPVIAGEPAARALRQGMPLPEDPQAASGRRHPFPPVADVRAVEDGEVLRVGPLAVTAHRTPGHTPGGTTWTWRSCQGARCLDLVFADSLNPISDEGFRFIDQGGRVEAFAAGIALLASLPCDVLVTGHPDAVGLFEQVAARERGDADALVKPGECKALAAALKRKLDDRVGRERQDAAAK